MLFLHTSFLIVAWLTGAFGQELFAGSQGGPVGSGPDAVGETVIGWEGPLVPQDYSRDLFNDFGFVVRGNFTNGEEFCIWLFMYRQIGAQEYVINEDLFQLSFIHGNFTDTQTEAMTDTPFVNVGQDLEDYAPIGTLKSTFNSSDVEYTFEGFTLGSHDNLPSHAKTWTAVGSRGGVTVNLTMQQHGDEIYHAGSFSDLTGCDVNSTATNYNCTGDFGGIVHMNDVTGTFSYNGSIVTIDTAYGVHERIIMASSVPSRILTSWGNGGTWIHGWGKQIDSWVLLIDCGPLSQSLVNVNGESTATTGIANTSVAETGHWLDPKSNQLVPYKWHTFSEVSNGRMDSDITAFGRLYYYWVRKGGMVITYQYIADAVTTFTYPNGSTITESQVAFVEYFRTVYISTPVLPNA